MTMRDARPIWLAVGLIAGLMLASLLVPHGLEYRFTHGPGCVVHYDVYGY